MTKTILLLGIAILSEILATTFLKSTEGFSRFLPTCLVLSGYGIAFYLLGLIVKSLPVGIVYALWSGLGIVGTNIFAFFLYKQKPDIPTILGMILIIAGVFIIQLYSSK